jgi:nucleoside-diphosphate-sugar epimerase
MAATKANAIVLGGTGFIGRNLVKMLLDSGACAFIRSVDKVFPQTAFLSKEHAAVYENPACQFMQGNLSSPGQWFSLFFKKSTTSARRRIVFLKKFFKHHVPLGGLVLLSLSLFFGHSVDRKVFHARWWP